MGHHTRAFTRVPHQIRVHLQHGHVVLREVSPRFARSLGPKGKQNRRDEDYGAYLREDTGGIQFGPCEFEKDLKLFAVDRVRLDKSYRAINREICKDMTPFEAGLDRFVALRDRQFIGKDALLRQKGQGDIRP